MSKYLFAGLALVVLVIGISHVNAGKRQPALLTLYSPERVFPSSVFIKDALVSANREAVCLLDNTGKVSFSDQQNGASKSVYTHMDSPNAMAMDANGILYIADERANQIAIVGANGELIGKRSFPHPHSLAVLESGKIVVASPYKDSLLHIINAEGALLNSFGRLKMFDQSNTEQNAALNKGKVVVDAQGSIYYVSQLALVPTIQKFNKRGKLLWERVINGEAVDFQLDMANRFLPKKSPDMVGNIHIITSATIDAKTNNLWISMNGSARMGVVYEYDSAGNKLREFSFVSDAGEQITAIRHIVVATPWVYLFSHNDIYRFKTDSTLPPDVVIIKVDCGTDIGWPTCKTNCNTSSQDDDQDCTAALKASINEGCCIVKAANCSSTQTDCSLSVTLCNSTTGNSSHSTELACSSGGGGGGGGGCEFSACDTGLHWDSGQCCCADGGGTCLSPILVDVAGNGFNLTDASGGVNFDLNADGIAEHLSWTSASSDDAFLALDRNNNGTIDNGTELFGSFTPQPPSPARNGFLALAEFDKPANGGNNDGQIDEHDAVFASLRLWRDSNHNGISETGELYTLASLGLKSIDLDYKESKRTDQYGNRFRYRAKVKDAQGAQLGRWAWDVYLVRSH
ncbi:MAG: hypothetical protein ACJ74J_01135 [Blastocatellia bacterium]